MHRSGFEVRWVAFPELLRKDWIQDARFSTESVLEIPVLGNCLQPTTQPTKHESGLVSIR